MSGRKADGMPDFHSLLGGAGGSFTSDELMAAMNSRSADPTSKDDERRNIVLDLGGDEGSVDDLSTSLDKPKRRLRSSTALSWFWVLRQHSERSTKETVEPAEMPTIWPIRVSPPYRSRPGVLSNILVVKGVTAAGTIIT